MKIFLKNNNAFKWHISEKISFKGYFYIDDFFYEKENALNFFKSIEKQSDVEETITSLNGVFTIIISLGDTTFIYSDITRSFPIFYTLQNNQLFLSDDIYYLKSKFNINDYDSTSEIELKASNHTYGKKTLLKNVYQIQASEYVEIKNESFVKSCFKYSYSIQKEKKSDYKTFTKSAYISFENSFKRLIKSLQNRTVVIPLSGGFDSRLITTILKKYNYKNIVCYTYGRKDSFEIENSKKTANTFGFQWYFIEYNEALIDGFLETNDFKKYVQFAGKLSSMPNLQEYFAVKYLKEHHLIPDNAIFIPGYAGDILGGSEYLINIPTNIDYKQLPDVILEKKMANHIFNNKEKKHVLEIIEKNFFLFDENYKQKIPETVLDDFNIKERIAKFIFNSANFYTFFGYEFRFPFWDMELLNFFREIPIKQKQSKHLFDDVLINKYFKPFNVFFETELQPKPQKLWLQKIKKEVKPFLPTFIKEKKIEKISWTNYKIMVQKMLFFLKSKNEKVKRTYNNYNEIITQWYIFISKNGFN